MLGSAGKRVGIVPDYALLPGGGFLRHDVFSTAASSEAIIGASQTSDSPAIPEYVK